MKRVLDTGAGGDIGTTVVPRLAWISVEVYGGTLDL